MARPAYCDIYKINKAPIGREDVQIDKEAFFKAAQDLHSGYAFKLWVYFASQDDTEDLECTKQGIMDSFNMARTTVYDNLKVLREKGYLVEREDGIYEFFEDPSEAKKNA